MAKGANKQLLNNSGIGQATSTAAGKTGAGISNYLTPQLENEASNPQGYTPQQMAYMNTASQQSLGGGDSATTGQANLESARTRNAGGFQGTVGTANRNSQKQLSENALGVQSQQAQLQQQQKQQALQSLQGLYGTDENTALGFLNSSDTALNDENQASGANSLLGKGILTSITAAGQAAGGLCPARGSLYLMADGSEKLVEDLRSGDVLMGIDGQPETIEEIQSATVPVLRIVTEDGYVARNSRTHAFALPFGGFVVAMHSRGAVIRTAKGTSEILSNAYDGQDEVFNVITDGSHTYRADGIWALGVGEAERHVSMQQWNEIAETLAT